MNIVRPGKLHRGDTIAVISPAGPLLDTARLDRGVRYLERMGYHVLVGKSATRVHGYLAGTDRQRLDDLHAMFADKRVKAIIAVRGGYGITRLLSRIDYTLIRRNPKILAGFSDVTALQLALWKKCRLVTFHGPMVSADMAGRIDPFTEEQFWRAVTSTRPAGRIRFPKSVHLRTLHGGVTSGRLLGGNLSLVCSLLGTPYQPGFNDAILFLEEIAEEPYRIDRMLTQLRNASILHSAKGMLTGQFTDCGPADPKKPSFTVPRVLRENALLTSHPFLANLPFGHVRRKLTLPIGIRARLDAGRRTLELMEPAVV